jgi:LacI family transcriptional regulator, galactose operon repressor
MSPMTSSADGLLAATTLRQVAELANVSTATVARVLQRSERVSPETRSRVEAVLEATGYRHNAVASGLRRQRTNTVGHVLRGGDPNPFYTGVALGLQHEAAAHGYQVLLGSAQDAGSEAEVVEAFLARRVDAVVFTTPISAANVETAVRAGVRVVQVERPVTREAPAIVVDNLSGSHAATRHLIDLGHEWIAFIGVRSEVGIPPTVEDERLGGYARAMEEAGLEPRVLIGEYDYPGSVHYRAHGRTYLRRLVEEGPVPTAVFAGSDTLAAGILQGLYELDMRVPQDMSVVGFDDTFSGHLSPPLTTVALPMEELGRQALRLAVVDRSGTHGTDSTDSTDGPDDNDNRTPRLVARFVLRASTAAPRRRRSPA